MKSLSSNFLGLPKSTDWSEALQYRSLFVSFDKDGTLVPICDHPDMAIPSAKLTSAISELANAPKITTAIISARSVSNLSVDFENGKTILAGNYGLEIKYPDSRSYLHPAAVKHHDDITRLKHELQNLIPASAKVIVDDNIYSICLHWHPTPPAEQQTVHAIVSRLKESYNHLLWRRNATSYEILPMVNWTKANALEAIHQHLEHRMRPDLSIYFGDSDQDEHAFSWINSISGISVRVGQEPISKANLRLKSPTEVHGFVADLVAMRKNSITALPDDSC